MDRLTIVKSDNFVSIDGVGVAVDCSALSDDFHALHWNGWTGEVEFVSDHYGNRKPNLTIMDLEPYQSVIDTWRVNKKANDIVAAETARVLAEQTARLIHIASPLVQFGVPACVSDARAA